MLKLISVTLFPRLVGFLVHYCVKSRMEDGWGIGVGLETPRRRWTDASSPVRLNSVHSTRIVNTRAASHTTTHPRTGQRRVLPALVGRVCADGGTKGPKKAKSPPRYGYTSRLPLLLLPSIPPLTPILTNRPPPSLRRLPCGRLPATRLLVCAFLLGRRLLQRGTASSSLLPSRPCLPLQPRASTIISRSSIIFLFPIGHWLPPGTDFAECVGAHRAGMGGRVEGRDGMTGVKGRGNQRCSLPPLPRLSNTYTQHGDSINYPFVQGLPLETQQVRTHISLPSPLL